MATKQNKQDSADFTEICRIPDSKFLIQKEKKKDASSNEKSTKLAELLGNLKAVEAKERVKIYRNKQDQRDELPDLLRAQPTALDAVHLQNLLQITQPLKIKDPLDKYQRLRVEDLINGDYSWIQRSN